MHQTYTYHWGSTSSSISSLSQSEIRSDVGVRGAENADDGKLEVFCELCSSRCLAKERPTNPLMGVYEPSNNMIAKTENRPSCNIFRCIRYSFPLPADFLQAIVEDELHKDLSESRSWDSKTTNHLDRDGKQENG